jgi:hypothetical protein
MKITLSPIASDHTTEVSVAGLVVTIDGTPIDLSVIPEGGYAEPEDDSPFVGKVTRDEATIRYHYESTKAEPNQSADLAEYTFEVTSGSVPCPIVWKPEPKAAEEPLEVAEGAESDV